MPAAEQADLRHSPRSTLDSAPDREVGECQGDPACDAQAEPAVGRSPPRLEILLGRQSAGEPSALFRHFFRRRRPYTRYQQAVHKYPNLLDRNFHQAKPNQFWVTDITYIPIPGSMLYMCAVLDLCGKAVLAWKIGADMSSSLVTDTIREALKREKVTGGLALHSDQGSQYTSQAYFDLMQAYHVSPSMSSPGCPYDNAAMENFFGTLKTECLYRAHFTTRTEVEQLVTEYVDFYNFERISLKNGLTPVEFRGKTV